MRGTSKRTIVILTVAAMVVAGCHRGQRSSADPGAGSASVLGATVEPRPAGAAGFTGGLLGVPRVARPRRRHGGGSGGLRPEQPGVRPLPQCERVQGAILPDVLGCGRRAELVERLGSAGRRGSREPAVGGRQRPCERRRARAGHHARDVSRGTDAPTGSVVRPLRCRRRCQASSAASSVLSDVRMQVGIGTRLPKPPAFKAGRPCSAYWGEKMADDKPPAYGATAPYTVCGYEPDQIRSAYGMSDAIAAGIDGTGQTVAVIDAFASPTIDQVLRKYSARHGLPAADLTQYNAPVTPGSDIGNQQGWWGEETLDLESNPWARSRRHVGVPGRARQQRSWGPRAVRVRRRRRAGTNHQQLLRHGRGEALPSGFAGVGSGVPTGRGDGHRPYFSSRRLRRQQGSGRPLRRNRATSRRITPLPARG